MATLLQLFDKSFEKLMNSTQYVYHADGSRQHMENELYTFQKAVRPYLETSLGSTFLSKLKNSQRSNEGNEFTGQLEKARNSGKSHFEVDGKKYPVKENEEYKLDNKEWEKIVKHKIKTNEDCWDGYTQKGMKEKNGKSVPNCVPESIEPLNEDLGTLKNIPLPWAKILTKNGFAGERSSFELHNIGTIRSDSGFKKSIIFAADMSEQKGNVGAALYINDTPFAMILKTDNYGKENFSVVLPSGEKEEKSKTHKAHWSGKYVGSGNNRRFVEPVYNTYKQKTMTKTDMYYALFGDLKKLLEIPENVYEITADQYKTLNISIKVIKQDTNRVQLKGERQSTKNKLDGIDQTRKDIVKDRYITAMINKIEKLKGSLLHNVDGAVEKAKAGKYDSHGDSLKIPNDYMNKIREMNGLLTQLNSLQSGKDYYLGSDNKLGFEKDYNTGKQKLGFNLKIIFDRIKQLENSI